MQQHDLELGRYSDEELLELADGDVHGGTGIFCSASAAISVYVSSNTCPTTACTSRC